MKLENVLEWFLWLTPIELVFGILLGAYYFSYLKTKYRYLLVYLIICLSADILSRVVGEFYGTNLLLLIIFSLLELGFFYSFFRLCYFKRKIPIYFIVVALATIYMMSEVVMLYKTPVKEFQAYSKTLGSFIILMMVISFLFECVKTKKLNSEIIKSNSIFIVYFSINMMFFLPLNFLINVSSSTKYYLWGANLFVTIVFYGFIVWEVWKNGLKQKQLQLG